MTGEESRRGLGIPEVAVAEIDRIRYFQDSNGTDHRPITTNGFVPVEQQNPVYLRSVVAGIDGNGYVRYTLTDSSGRIITSSASTANVVQATSPWTVRADSSSTANAVQATSPWIVQTTTSTVQVEQVTSPWIVQTTTSTIPQVTSIGSTVDVAVVNHAVQTPVDVQAVYYSPVTVFSSTSVLSGSAAVSDWVDISTFKTVTCSIYSAQAGGTLIIEVSPTSSTANAYEYYRDNSVSAGTFTPKSFTEAFYWVRMSFIASANSTIDGWIGRRTL